jgi:hypothetical protein
MPLTLHATQRMSQRGIPRRLVDFALLHGRVEGDRHVLDRRETQRVVDELREQLRIALRVLDKGGVTVVEGDGQVITTYNVEPRGH